MEKEIDCFNRQKYSHPEDDCQRHGTCCECIRYHKNRKERPFCIK